MGDGAQGQFTKHVHLWMKAFIPSQHPQLPDYIKTTQIGTHVIPAPGDLPFPFKFDFTQGSCFATDNRSFDSSPLASARATVELMIVISGREMSYQKVEGREVRRIGETHIVDCATGLDKSPAKTADLNGIEIGDVKKDNFSRVFYTRASVANPFYSILPGVVDSPMSPAIDFSFVTTYDILARSIELKGSVGYFPSFEAYYNIDGGPIKSIFQMPPYQDSTALSLFDLNLGVNTRNFAQTIRLDSN